MNGVISNIYKSIHKTVVSDESFHYISRHALVGGEYKFDMNAANKTNTLR